MSEGGAARVLVVEDEVDLARGLAANLELEGYAVDVATDGAAALDAVARRPPDLVVLDWMLPEVDGLRVLRLLRRRGVEAPVLVLTARGAEDDKVTALRLGADDYVTKPFGLLELLARVEALLRRAGRAAPPARERYRFADVEVDATARVVRRGGDDVALAPKELDLLLALLRRHGAAATRLDLLREVWGYPDAVVTRTVDTHVAELRRKLEPDPTHPRHLLTVRKHGYRLDVGGGGGQVSM